MQQKQIRTIGDLIGSAGTIKAAALAKGAGIPLLHNTAVDIGADADALTTACTTHDAGKVVLANTRAALAAVIFTVRAFLMLGRDILKPVLGNEYSQAFDVLGLVGSIAIPRTAEELRVVLLKFKAFFTTHPDLEDESRNITAAQCQALYDQLVAAESAVNLQEDEVDTLVNTRDLALETMRTRIRSLMAELSTCLSPLDPRWLAFGFNKPGATETPDIVQGILATLIGPTTAAVKWAASARADYYRIWFKVHGSEADYVAVGSPADLDFTIENLPAGSTLDIVVTAVNNGGESPVSEVITITTHA